jgi:hypothetical protein
MRVSRAKKNAKKKKAKKKKCRQQQTEPRRRCKRRRVFFREQQERGTDMQKNDIVEGRAIARFHSALVGSKNRGDRVRTTLEHAEQLAALGVLEILAPKQKPAGPGESKPAGPEETKGGAGGKKSSGALTDGRPIGSPSSSAPGSGIVSSSLAAGRALFLATASRVSALRGKIATGGRSPSSR